MKAILCAVLFVIASASLGFGQGTYTRLDYPGALETFVQGINSAGDVVGYYYYSDNNYYGFLWRAGVFTSIYAGRNLTETYGVNDSEQVVGYAANFGTKTKQVAFIYDANTQQVTHLDFSGPSTYTLPYSINNEGTIAGAIQKRAGSIVEYAGFELNGQAYTRIMPDMSAPETLVTSINNSGKAVGRIIADTFSQTGFVCSGSSCEELKIPQEPSAVGFGINDHDAIVGIYSPSANVYSGFLYQGGVFQSLQVPGSVATVPTAINNSGLIAGYFSDSGGNPHGFIWTPPTE